METKSPRRRRSRRQSASESTPASPGLPARLPESAVTALSLASSACAAARTFAAALDEATKTSANATPFVGNETTLIAARRVVAEAQESMSPRLLFLEGPSRSGKTRAARAVMDLPEVRRLWLIRARGLMGADVAGGVNLAAGASAGPGGPGANFGAADVDAGSFAFASFARVFRELLGFSARSTPRERKNAVVQLLEGCGTGTERYGRYYKAIMELLELDDDEGLRVNASMSSFSSWEGDRARSFRGGGRVGRGPHSSDSSLDHGGESPTRRGLGAAERQTSLTRLGTTRESSVGGFAAAPRRMASSRSQSGLSRSRPVRGLSGESDDLEISRPHGRGRLGSKMNGILDVTSQGAMTDATNHLSPIATDALLDDGFGTSFIALEKLDEDDERSDSDAEDASASSGVPKRKAPPTSESLCFVAGRLTSAVALTRQRNGVQRRDHNLRFRASLQRRKHTLTHALRSRESVAGLCKTLALMFERLLLGRSVQAAPAQPSLPGFLLFVEDAHTLDPISAGVIRACLEHCSIPLVVMMTHRRDDAALAAMDSEGKLAGKLANDATAAGTRVARVASSRAASGTDVEGPISSDDSHPDGGLSSGRDDVWGLKVSADLARHAGASAAASRRDNFEWMLEQYATTVVDVAALSRSDLRELVEVFAAERLIPRGDASRGVVTSGGKLGDVSSGADGASSGSDHSSTPGDGRKVLQRRSGRDANRQRLNRSHFVGLPIALHGAVYKQTGGDPLFARFVVALLVTSGAIAATTNANGVVDVTVRSDDSSVADIVSLSFRDAVLRVVDRAISKDARVAVKTLACCGDAFDAAFAHEMVARAIAEADAAELDSYADDGAFAAEDRAKALSRVDRAGANDPGRPAVPHDVEMAYAAAARSERAGAAILELRREGLLVVDFGATEEAFVVADALYSEAHVEFAHADASFPVARPPALRAWAEARERTRVSGSAGSGVELGLESRAPWICFANASTRMDVYDALPAASRRAAHLDACRTLRARAQHAEDALTDAAGASALLERSADHLAVALALDRATLRRWTAGQHGDGRDGGSTLGLRRLRIGLGPGAMAVSDADSGASPGEVVAALSGYEARLSCHEKSAAASLRRGAIRSALTSVAAAGAAAAAWSEASRAATRAYQRSRAAALAERGDALVTPESAKTLLIRNAAWAALAARLAADVGDAHPPLLCAAADEHAVAPARAARRAFRALDIKWPLVASAMDAGGAAAELAAIRDVRLLLPDEFLRRDEGREGDEKENTEKKKIVPANAEDDDGLCGGCFGISVSRGLGATGLRASLRDALFASVRDDALDALASEALSAKARAADAAADAAAAAVGGSLPFRTLGTSTNAGADDGEGEETAAAAEAKAIAALRADFFSPLADVSPGVTDVLHYASQIKPGISRETRLWARSELALVAVSDLALSAVIAGRPTPAARALVAHARAFCDAPNPRAVDAALFLNLAAAMCPQGRRASALDRAAGVLETEARRLREARDREDAAECSARAPGFREAVRSRASDADGTVATESSVPATVAAAEKLKGPHRRRKVRFAQTPPPPRAGPALLARTLACCNQGDWVAARAAAAAAVALLDGAGGDARLADMGRSLGAVADAHLGHWSNCLASVEELARDRARHAEIGPWVLAVRISATTATGHPRRATALWRDATRAPPLEGLHLSAAEFSERAGAEDGGVVAAARHMPVLVACRAFAAQALWSSGERVEAVIQAEQTCEQLRMLHAPAHCLLPAAALAVGETVARACHLGMLDRRKGRKLLAECHQFLAVRAARLLPFAADLAEKLKQAAPERYL